MLPGVQRVWGSEPSHSQVNSHVGSWWEWSPKRTPETSESVLRGQNSMACCALYINGKILKCRCPKWARIAHLDIWNASYGRKKARESNSRVTRSLVPGWTRLRVHQMLNCGSWGPKGTLPASNSRKG
jgi:hypothetical protein